MLTRYARGVLSDWFRGPDDYTNKMRAWATTGEEAYDMVTIEKAADWLRDAGYTGLAFAGHGLGAGRL